MFETSYYRSMSMDKINEALQSDDPDIVRKAEDLQLEINSLDIIEAEDLTYHGIYNEAMSLS